MRGFGALLFIGLFVLFIVLKLVGKGLKAGKAALAGDLGSFISALGTEDSNRIRIAARYLKAKLSATDNCTEDTWLKSVMAHRQLGYAYAWSTLLWRQLPTEKRARKAEELLSVLFGPSLDYWLLAGVLLEARSEAFIEGAESGMADYISFIADQELK